MTTVYCKRLLIIVSSLLLFFCTSCSPKPHSFTLTKGLFGSGVSISGTTKAFSTSVAGFSYSMEVWSLPPSFTSKVNKQFSRISQSYPDVESDELISIRWRALPADQNDIDYYTLSKIQDNKGITTVQEIEILLKAVLREKGNYYSYIVSNKGTAEDADYLCFYVYCSERKLLIELKRTKETQY